MRNIGGQNLKEEGASDFLGNMASSNIRKMAAQRANTPIPWPVQLTIIIHKQLMTFGQKFKVIPSLNSVAALAVVTPSLSPCCFLP